MSLFHLSPASRRTALLPSRSEADGSPRTLGKGRLLRVQLPRGGGWVSCETGRVWITRSGSPEDIVLREGSSQAFPGRSHLLIEALTASEIRLRG